MLRVYFVTAILLFAGICTNAQLCQGSLGDPIVNISFGSGANPGSPLAAAATGYGYVANDCPNDGFYTVRSNTSNCFSSSWHNVPADHTGNTNGYFMLVNASIQPSAFYVDTVRGLCGNSTYEFAAWVMNVILSSACGGNTIQPNLTFTIEKTDGTVLQTYNSGNIPTTPTPQWKQYGFFFTTAPGSAEVVLRIVNNASGGCGNDLALDDITFRPCGPKLTPSIVGQTTSIENICEGTGGTFNFSCTVSAGFNLPVLQWQQRAGTGSWTDITGANNSTLTVSFPNSQPIGSYDYRLTVAEMGNMGSPQCRISSTPVTIQINANPTITASNNGPVCERSSAQLTATGASSYVWTGPAGYSTNADNPVIAQVQLPQAGNYIVKGTNAAGCSATANTSLLVNAAPVASLAYSDTAVCFGQQITLLASGGSSYGWSPANGLSATNIAQPKAIASINSRYTVTVTNAAGCTDSNKVSISVIEKAIAHAGPDKNIISGGTAILEGSITGLFTSFAWQPAPSLSSTAVLQPVANPTADAQYILTVQSPNNCGSSTDTVQVKIYKGIYIPNAFTPNADGLNDTWNIPALDAYPNFELVVYNRYGQPVYQNSKRRIPWNGFFKGEESAPGAYTYVIKLNLLNLVLKGTVILIR